MRKQVNDYPLGVQDLLRWAVYYAEQLDKLKREFQAWQQTQDIERVQVVTLEAAGAALRADRMRKAGLSAPRLCGGNDVQGNEMVNVPG